MKLEKNWAKAKQHAEAELLLLENYVVSSSTLSSKDNRRYSKKCAKKVRLFKWEYMVNGKENEAKNKK